MGSVLAAVGTAMPETLIAIVALLGVAEGSEDVAIGAIVGAPFLLATLAMGLVGLFAYLYREKREQGVALTVAQADPRARPALLPGPLHARGAAFLGPAGAGADRGRDRLPPRLRALRPPHPQGRREVQGEETLNPLIFERRGEPAKTRRCRSA